MDASIELFKALLHLFKPILDIFLLISPFFLLGLLIAGIVHVLVSKKLIEKAAGNPGIKGVVWASLLGIPIPVCSCGVVPIAIEFRKKGASGPATLSFLISTPETSADSILVTWAMLGPVMAIVRPIVGLSTGIFAGILGIGFLPDLYPKPIAAKDKKLNMSEQCTKELIEDDYIGVKKIIQMSSDASKRNLHGFFGWWGGYFNWYRSDEVIKHEHLTKPSLRFRDVGRKIFRYSYLNLAEEILPSFVVGIIIAGIMNAIIPSGLFAYGIRGDILSYIIALLISLPIYMCASASTPIAASLILKGLNPGAALVFLLAGPATNITSLTILKNYYGNKFTGIYLLSIIIFSLGAGISFDYFAKIFNYHLKPNVATGNSIIFAMIEWISFLLLITLVIWHAKRGILLPGLKSMWVNFVNATKYNQLKKFHKKLLQTGVLSLIFIIYILSGLTIVHEGAVGFSKIFGKVVQRDIPPGLHYIFPWPVGKLDVFYPLYPRQVNVYLDNKKNKSNNYPNINIELITHDENLIEVAASVQYVVNNSYLYLYQLSNQKQLVSAYLNQVIINSFIHNDALGLLTDQRVLEQEKLQEALQAEVNTILSNDNTKKQIANVLGIDILDVNIYLIYPNQMTLNAFYDVQNAKEDMETYTINALATLEQTTLRARGNAGMEIDRANALSYEKARLAEGKSISLIAKAKVVANYRDILNYLIWLETTELVLNNKQLFILPAGVSQQDINLWRNQYDVYLNNKHRGKVDDK